MGPLHLQTYSGGEIRKVVATVVNAPDSIREQHADLVKARRQNQRRLSLTPLRPSRRALSPPQPAANQP